MVTENLQGRLLTHPSGNGNPAQAYIPYRPTFARSRYWPAAFLILSCVTSIFTNFLNVTVTAIAWPAFFLAFACGVTRHRFIWLGLLPLSAFTSTCRL